MPGISYWAIAGIVLGLLAVLVLLSGIRIIPNNRIGVIEKRWSSKGSIKTGLIALQGEAGKRVLFRSFRVLCHPLARCTWIALYGVDGASPERVGAFLDRVERRMCRLSRWR